jgi:hypothetical protein
MELYRIQAWGRMIHGDDPAVVFCVRRNPFRVIHRFFLIRHFQIPCFPDRAVQAFLFIDTSIP